MHRRQKLVEIIDAQRQILLDKGPTVDFVRLQLHLAHCEFQDGNLKRVASRLEEAYLDAIEGTTELEIGVTCLAWFAAEIYSFDPLGVLAEHSQIKELVDEQLADKVEAILSETADQFAIVANAIHALALYLPETALNIAHRLNTIDRRQEAMMHIAVTMCDATTVVPNAQFLMHLIDEIGGAEELDDVLYSIVTRFCDDVEGGKRDIEHLVELESKLHLFHSSKSKVECLGAIAKCTSEAGGPSAFLELVSKKLLEEFADIGTPMEKYQVACSLIADLRVPCPEIAAELFDYISKSVGGRPMGANIESGLFYLLDLQAKAVYALARAKLLTSSDVETVCQLITTAQEPLTKISLFATLVCCITNR